MTESRSEVDWGKWGEKDYHEFYDFMGVNVSKCIEVYTLNVCRKSLMIFYHPLTVEEKKMLRFTLHRWFV